MLIIYSNARSLCPKMDSLLECMEEIEVSLAVVTETWFRDSRMVEEVADLSLGADVGLLYRNRNLCPNRVTYGGVAILWRDTAGHFKQLDFPNPYKHEILVAAGSLRGQCGKLVVVCYLPPNITREKADKAGSFITDVITDISLQ